MGSRLDSRANGTVTAPRRKLAAATFGRISDRFGHRENPAEALWVYERCRTLLSEELGVNPSPETQAVHLGLLESL